MWRTVILLAGLWSLTACAHADDLDANGCHERRGTYHCHRGPLAGQAFKDRNEAAAVLRNMQTPRQ